LLLPKLPGLVSKIFAPLHSFLYHKWFIDELYEVVFVRPLMCASAFLWKFIDTKIIDGLIPMGSARLSLLFGRVVNYVQTGYIYHYALMMIFGLVVILTYFVIYY
jgi:NADH-quinone oxidoreductase subunit L